MLNNKRVLNIKYYKSKKGQIILSYLLRVNYTKIESPGQILMDLLENIYVTC